MTGPATLVLVVTGDAARQAEALRAALGLTLRGAAVEVLFVAPRAPATPLARRAAATLAMFGHRVDDAPGHEPAAADAVAGAIARATAVEVWT